MLGTSIPAARKRPSPAEYSRQNSSTRLRQRAAWWCTRRTSNAQPPDRPRAPAPGARQGAPMQRLRCARAERGAPYRAGSAASVCGRLLGLPSWPRRHPWRPLGMALAQDGRAARPEYHFAAAGRIPMMRILESWEFGDPESVAARREDQRLSRERRDRERVAALLRGARPRPTIGPTPELPPLDPNRPRRPLLTLRKTTA